MTNNPTDIIRQVKVAQEDLYWGVPTLSEKLNNQAWDALTLIPALEQWAERMTWRPIETAPKDGTMILGTSVAYKDCSLVAWYQHTWRAYGDGQMAILSQGDTWTDYIEPYLTHWMKLPQPPKEQPHE